MRLTNKYTLFFFIVFNGFYSLAASRYWVGGAGNWTNATSHWANTSGGSPAAGNLPASGDDVYFDSNSGTGTVTVNSAVTVTNITFSTSCSAILLDITSNTTSVTSSSGGLVLNSGSQTVRLSGGRLTVTNDVFANGGTMQLNSGTLNVYCSPATGTHAFGINGGTVNCAGATINVGDGSNEVFNLAAGSLTVSAGTINVRTEFYTLGGTFTLSGGTMNVNISTSSERFYSITMYNTTYNLTGGVIDVKNVVSSGAVAVILDESCTPGTINGGTLKVTATNFSYGIGIDEPIYNLEINSSGRTASVAYHNLDLNGNFILTAGTFDIGTNAYSMNVAGNWTNNGTGFTYGTQTVTFDGSSAQQLLGSSATTFYNLTLSNSSGLTLAPSTGIKTTVRNTLTLSNGKITLGNFDLNIGAVGVSGSIASSSSSKYIITNGSGVLNQYNMGSGQRTSVLFPIGNSASSYTPVTWNSSGTSTVDNFSASVSSGVLANGTSGSTYTTNAVNRTWNITEGTPSGSSATLTVQWNASDELTSFTRASCYVSHYTSSWVQTSTYGAASGSGPYTKVSGTVTSFSPFAVGANNTLPIELISFEALEIENKSVQLNWITLSENNNDYFTVERSADALHFEPVLKMEGAHFSNIRREYTMLDGKTLKGKSYYRLKQTDFDGKFTYSKIVGVELTETAFNEMLVAPNLVTDFTTLVFTADEQENNNILLVDTQGKIIYTLPISCQKGSNSIPMDLAGVVPGIYFVLLTTDSKRYLSRLIKQ